MTTATSESLFIKKLDPRDLFKKEASIARMPDDDKKWPEVVLSELHKQLPFMSGMDVSLNFTRIQPEAGYGFGYALVRGQKNAVNLAPKDENQMVKIPIIVADRHLEPFHVFHFEGRTLPLTRGRFEEALENPRVFAGVDKMPKTQKSLIDQLYPPYQQRQGFGRVVDGSGMSGSSMGINKTAQAPAMVQQPSMAQNPVNTLTPGQLKRLGTLKQYEGIDRARAQMSDRDKAKEMADNAIFAGTAGGLTQAGLAAYGAHKGGVPLTAKALGKAGLKGVGIGAGLSLLGKGYQTAKAKMRDRDRQKQEYSQYLNKQATAEDIPNLRGAESEDIRCKTCKFYGSSTETGAGVCNKYASDVNESMVCDTWEAAPTSSDKLASYTKYLMGARQ